MIAPDQFDGLIAEVARLNELDNDTAGAVVVAVGDTLTIDENGLIVADLEDGRTLHVRWPMNEEDSDQ